LNSIFTVISIEEMNMSLTTPSPSRLDLSLVIPLDSQVEDFRHRQPQRTQISILTPAYNEASILQEHLTVLCDYLQGLEAQYEWEIVVVNDGSRDETGILADDFARSHPSQRVRIVHHKINQGLGQALRTGFEHCKGDYVVVLDLDLSYSPDHIERLLHRIETTQAGMVVASPYMPGGSIANVPWVRKELSIWANRFLAVASKGSLATLTGMVRVYDAKLLRRLNLRSRGMEINPEVVYKALLLLEKVDEIPGHLHWRVGGKKAAKPAKQTAKSSNSSAKRKSSMKIARHIWDTVFSGFLFRPVMFFVLPSLLFFMMSIYANGWALTHCWTNYQAYVQRGELPHVSEAVALAFAQAPHTFFIGGITLMLAIQLFSLGVLSLQNKSYFEEMFYLNSAIYEKTRQVTEKI
jgi:glycosyltransferase involved in cell wall biosynthesis